MKSLILLTQNQYTKLQLFLLVYLLFTAPLRVFAQTQITPDGTLPTAVSNSSENIFDITGGLQPNNGTNLFHSFGSFSVQAGDTARFIYSPGIENIITRVTGGTRSQIDGTIQTILTNSRTPGNANLYLINPAGIIFGANAKLDMGGGFIGSTADSVKLSDGTEFSAINPTANPILTISVPLGLQFGSNPDSNITVSGAGNKVILNEDFSRDSSNNPSGLSFVNPTGQTLALVGGKILVDGGNISSPQGNIELWSVNRGLVKLTNSSGIQFQPTEGINYSNIDLVNAASVNASGNKAGNIQLHGANISLSNGSVIFSDTLGTGGGGELNVFASESLRLQGAVFNPPENIIFSGIFGESDKNATSNGSNIRIETPTLQISNGAQIAAGTFGSGNAGSLTVKTGDIEIQGFFDPLGPSGLFTPVGFGATGKGGNLAIVTNNLKIVDGGQVYTNTFGLGQAGDLQIQAQNIDVQGGTPFGSSLIATTVFNSLPNKLATENGRGGNLRIQTGNLRVSDGGQISASTAGDGDAGNLDIIANTIELTGFDADSKSGLFASAIRGSGEGGQITVTANVLNILDGATISVSNFPSQASIAPPGTGAAGSIELNAPTILLKNQATITANTNAGDRGNIVVRSQNLQLRQNSQISANAQTSLKGGNIDIGSYMLVAIENSDITANANAANSSGGKITINAQAIIGTKFRPILTPKSDITASGGGVSNGVVEIQDPDADPSQALLRLPDNKNSVIQPIVASCSVSLKNRFVIKGKGGLPENPSQPLIGQNLWQDTRNISIQPTQKIINFHSVNKPQQIIEAQRLTIAATGEIELVANNTNPQPPEQQSLTECASTR